MNPYPFFWRGGVLFSFFILSLGFVPRAMASEASGREPNLSNEAYVAQIESNLRQNILPFWLQHTRDRQRGGFFGQIDAPLRIQKDAPRGALLTARILWTFSAAYRRYHDPAYLEMARWAYDDLNSHFWDHEHGGLYWKISASGEPLDARKILYVQAFGIYGLSEFHRATHEQEPLNRAIELYRLIEAKAHDQSNRGYFEEFSRDWKISRERGEGSAMGSRGQKSQNVHLHVMEAWANLYRVWPDAELKRSLHEVVDVLLDRMLDPKTHHLRLFLDEDWTPRSDTISFGHDIEFAWLLTETAELLDHPDLTTRARKEAVEIANVTLREGVDKDGGVFAEANLQGVTDTYKEWWPQAEASVGFMNAYHLSGEIRYHDAALRTWTFIEERLVDRTNGEWLIGISDSTRRAAPLLAGFWKCPYHNGRACMEMIDRLRTRSN